MYLVLEELSYPIHITIFHGSSPTPKTILMNLLLILFMQLHAFRSNIVIVVMLHWCIMSCPWEARIRLRDQPDLYQPWLPGFSCRSCAWVFRMINTSKSSPPLAILSLHLLIRSKGFVPSNRNTILV